MGDHLKSQHKGEAGEEGFSGGGARAAEMWGDDREEGVWLYGFPAGKWVWGSIPEKGAWGEFHFGRVSFKEPTGHPGRASHEELARPHTCPQHIHGARTEVTLARGRVPGQAALLEGPGRGQGAPAPAPSLPEMQKRREQVVYEWGGRYNTRHPLIFDIQTHKKALASMSQ